MLSKSTERTMTRNSLCWMCNRETETIVSYYCMDSLLLYYVCMPVLMHICINARGSIIKNKKWKMLYCID